MIRLTTSAGAAICIRVPAIAFILQASASTASQGINTIVRLMDGTLVECRTPFADVEKLLKEQKL